MQKKKKKNLPSTTSVAISAASSTTSTYPAITKQGKLRPYKSIKGATKSKI